MADSNMSFSDYMEKTDILATTFSEICDRDTIYSILESCDGDLNHAANVIVSITCEKNVNKDMVQGTSYDSPMPSDSGPETKKMQSINDNISVKTSPPNSVTMTTNVCTQTNLTPIPKLSYAGASMSKMKEETISKQTHNSIRAYRKPIVYNNIWTEQIKRIVTYHNEGTRTLIIMRGPPGSGKTYLANKIQEYTVGPTPDQFHIFSADDYFMVNGVYHFNKHELPNAHSFNQKRAFAALEEGVSPVIIDNTNIEFWEINPYAKKGVNCGYLIEIVEPEGKYAKNVRYLTNKNIHGVSASTIRKKIDRWIESPITTATVMKLLDLAYTPTTQPPVLRRLPKIVHCTNDDCIPKTPSAEVNIDSQHERIDNQKEVLIEDEDTSIINEDQNRLLGSEQIYNNLPMRNLQTKDNNEDIISHKKENLQHYLESTACSQDDMNSKQFLETKLTNCTSSQVNYAKFLEDYEKVENEWDNGESWEEDKKDILDKSIVTQLFSNVEAKLPRNKKPHENQSTLDDDNDSQNMHRPLKFLAISNDQPSIPSQIMVESRPTTTSMEIGDTISNIENQNENLIEVKNITNSPNFNVVQNICEKNPINENNQSLESGDVCANEDKHFKYFRNMFKNSNEVELRIIFDDCFGDINSAVNIVLDDSTVKSHFECNTSENELETNEGPTEAYNCNVMSQISAKNDNIEYNNNIPSTSTGLAMSNSTRPSQKKKNPISDASLALKKQLEQNIVISDSYSKNSSKYRKIRTGEIGGNGNTDNIDGNIDIGVKMENDSRFDTSSALDTHHTNNNNENVTESSILEVNNTVDSNDDPGLDEVDEPVNIYLGYEFLNQLDTYFKRTDVSYSDKIEPKINMPVSILNEINALWLESLTYQHDMESKSLKDLMKQDEEFAKELALKELEMSQSAIEIEVPNFKEIMDMEYALSLYRKDYEELLQKDRPTDLATKLSKKKLYDLFPEVPQKVIDEIYMAHENSFDTTVTALLISQGRCDILQKENGINKFIMAQELKRQESFLSAEEKRLKEASWPALTSDITMKTVGQYRKKARKFWDFSDQYLRTANSKINEHVQIAINYKRLSELYTFRFEQANCIAAAGILQISAGFDSTIDLHYLQSNEAEQAVDIFLDEHIQRHKTPKCKKKRFNTLYIITGRGARSKDGSVLKPLVQQRLKFRHVHCSERNAGLLAAYISARNLLTYELYNRH